MNKRNISIPATALIATLCFSVASGMYFTGIYRMLDFFPSQTVDILSEGICYIIHALGIVAVALYVKYKDIHNHIRLFLPIMLGGILLCTFLLLVINSPTIIMLLYVIAGLFAGFLQGLYFIMLTVGIPREKRCIVFGYSYAAATAVNALVGMIGNGRLSRTMPSLIVYGALSAVACLILFLRPDNGLSVDCSHEKEATAPTEYHNSVLDKKMIFIFCGFVFFAWAVQSMGFFFPTSEFAELSVNGEVLRGFYAIGLIIAGYICNKDKKAVAICCLITTAFPLFFILVQARAGATLIVNFLSYSFAGLLAVYRFALAADMSDYTDSHGAPLTFICLSGLISGRIGEALGALTGIFLSRDPMILVAVTGLTLVITSGFFVIHFMELFTPVPRVVKSHDEMLTAFKLKYDLSSREGDVLNLLLDDSTNLEIAQKLFVSENTVRFHVSNILKKTGCDSRKAVKALFHSNIS